MARNKKNAFGQITKVERHHIETVDIYEVSESELKELEIGNDADTFLNIGLSCLSFASAFFISILTTSFANEFSKLLFCCISIIFGIAGVIMMILWWKKRKSKESIIDTIRKRKSANEHD